MLDWQQLLGRLKANGVEFVVIGGVAASLRGSPLVTYDLDVCAPLNEANLPGFSPQSPTSTLDSDFDRTRCVYQLTRPIFEISKR